MPTGFRLRRPLVAATDGLATVDQVDSRILTDFVTAGVTEGITDGLVSDGALVDALTVYVSGDGLTDTLTEYVSWRRVRRNTDHIRFR